MFENIIRQFKNPVTTILEKSEEEDTKKGIVKLAIISGIISLMNVISVIISILAKYSTSKYSSSYYTASELWEMRFDAMGEAKLLSGFFKTWVIIAISIAVGALILFIIAKLVKSSKEYSTTLSMVNNVLIIYIIGSILNIILSLIYAPLGFLISFATIIYISITLMNAFRDSLDIENSDILTLVTTGVLVVLMIILIVLMSSITGISLEDIVEIKELLD